jgi:hypothetical protein
MLSMALTRQIELMRRKQSHAHLDNRQTVMLENAFYQVSSLDDDGC